MSKSNFGRGWSSGVKPEEATTENHSLDSPKSQPRHPNKTPPYNSQRNASPQPYTADASPMSTLDSSSRSSHRTRSQNLSNGTREKLWKSTHESYSVAVSEENTPKKRELKLESGYQESAGSEPELLHEIPRNNVTLLINKFQKKSELNSLSGGKKIVKTVSKKEKKKPENEAEDISTSRHEIQFLRLDSTITDDGYNGIAPLSSNDLNSFGGKTISRRKSISMYDWAILNPNKSIFSLDTKNNTPIKYVRDTIPEGQAGRNPDVKPLRVFVGSWNTEYGVFSLETMLATRTTLVDTKSPVFDVSDSVLDKFNSSLFIGCTPHESQREKLRKEISSFSQPSYTKLSMARSENHFSADDTRRTTDLESSVDDDTPSEISRIKSSEINTSHMGPRRQSLCASFPHEKVSERGLAVNRISNHKVEPLSYWISAGYDIYIIALQEVISLELLDAILIYLNRVNSPSFYRVHFSEQKISGLGDGAYMTLKSTLIACFVSEDYANKESFVKVGSSKAISLNPLNGSKGAVSIILTLHQQIVCFISCHLLAGKPHDRVRAREFIRRKLAEAYSGFPDVNPTDVFHHIVWTGDFNFRVQELTARTVVNHLSRNDIGKIFSFDEICYPEFNVDFRADDFEESPITFFPTYKLFVGRKPSNYFDPDWIEKTYNVNFKVRWYKGGKTKSRVPSWTDRILKWSHPEVRSCLCFIPNTYKSALPTEDNFLLDSDHSPVSCGFLISPLNPRYSLPPVMFQDVREKGTQLPVKPCIEQQYCRNFS